MQYCKQRNLLVVFLLVVAVAGCAGRQNTTENAALLAEIRSPKAGIFIKRKLNYGSLFVNLAGSLIKYHVDINGSHKVSLNEGQKASIGGNLGQNEIVAYVGEAGYPEKGDVFYNEKLIELEENEKVYLLIATDPGYLRNEFRLYQIDETQFLFD